MKIGNITENQNTFSYKGQRFSEHKFIIAIRDSRYEYNVQAIVAVVNKQLLDLDTYEFENNVFATRPGYNNPNNIQDLPLSRFHINEIVKIDYATIVDNTGVENPNMPRIKTYNANINPLNTNQIIEIFEGTLKEEDGLFTPTSNLFSEIIKNIYLEKKNSFFVIVNNQIIGPFQALRVNGDSFHIIKDNYLKFGKYELNDDSFIEFEANYLNRKIYIPGITNLSLSYSENFDFISDDQLFNEFEKDLINNQDYFNDVNLNNALKVLKKAIENDKTNSKINSNERLKKLLEKGEKSLSKDIDLISSIPEIIDLKKEKEKINDDLLSARNESLSIKKQNKEATDSHTILLGKIADYEDKVNNLEDKIRNLEETKTAELESKKTDLDSEIKLLDDKKKNLKLEVTLQKESLERENDGIKYAIESYRRDKKELEDQIETLRDNFKDEQKQAQQTLERLIQSKVHFDFISGRDLSEQEDYKKIFTNLQVIDQYKKNQYREFRNELVNTLKLNNREFETHFIDNLLISIFQNTLTILAGVPGTGKTTLARLLTSIIAPAEKVREVSVNRGWTSQKDFIGYVNPLSKKFHSSSTDIFSLLKQMDHEAKNDEQYSNTPMAYVILDEANLSPLEHYWSSFYNLTDSSGMLEIKLGNNEVVKFPNNLRFIGTINYDQTTEELSPRVLDRINIIQLNKTNDIRFNNIKKEDIKRINLTFKRCQDYFEINESEELTNNSSAFKDIKTEFKKLKIYVSPRVEIGIKKYITIATRYMSDVNKPLDYCVAQRLLPLINLQGEENKQKLESLKTVLESNKCDLSIKILDEIISIGSENGLYEDNFNYFLTLSNV
jgi:MoxR-like ATPase